MYFKAQNKVFNRELKTVWHRMGVVFLKTKDVVT